MRKISLVLMVVLGLLMFVACGETTGGTKSGIDNSSNQDEEYKLDRSQYYTKMTIDILGRAYGNKSEMIRITIKEPYEEAILNDLEESYNNTKNIINNTPYDRDIHDAIWLEFYEKKRHMLNAQGRYDRIMRYLKDNDDELGFDLYAKSIKDKEGVEITVYFEEYNDYYFGKQISNFDGSYDALRISFYGGPGTDSVKLQDTGDPAKDIYWFINGRLFKNDSNPYPKYFLCDDGIWADYGCTLQKEYVSRWKEFVK